MTKLYMMAAGAGLGGILICIFAAVSWPKVGYLSSADPTANMAWLSIGGALVGIGILSLLLAFHAEAVTEAAERKYLGALEEHARRQAKAVSMARGVGRAE